MHRCPNCGYLLAPGWTSCPSCQTTVAVPVAAATPVGAGVASTASAPVITGFDPRYATPVRLGVPDAYGGAPGTAFERPPSAGAQWTPVTVGPARSSFGTLVARVVSAAIVVLAFYAGWKVVDNFLRGPDIPEAVQAYVDGEGVDYAPFGSGYSARLPSTPAPFTTSQEFFGATVTVSAGIATTDDYEAAVGVMDLPVAVGIADLEAGLDAPGASALLAVGEIDGYATVEHDGYDALDVDVSGPAGEEGRVLMVPVGNRVYLLTASAANGGTSALFDSMRDSFHIGTTA